MKKPRKKTRWKRGPPLKRQAPPCRKSDLPRKKPLQVASRNSPETIRREEKGIDAIFIINVTGRLLKLAKALQERNEGEAAFEILMLILIIWQKIN